MTLPAAPARMTSPSFTGGMYDLPSFIQPRIAGSSEMYCTFTSTSPAPGSATGTLVNSKSVRFGSPTGRAISLNWRLVSVVIGASSLRLHQLPHLLEVLLESLVQHLVGLSLRFRRHLGELAHVGERAA